MRALAIKDAGIPTTGMAYVVCRLGSGIPVFRSYVMNLANGGIHPRGVQVALNHGDVAKVIYFPRGIRAITSGTDESNYAGINLPLTEEQAITVLRGDEHISEAREVMALVNAHDACLATRTSQRAGRASRGEGSQGARFAEDHHQPCAVGDDRVVTRRFKEFAQLGCFIGLEASLMMPLMYFVHGEPPADPRDIVATMRVVGPEHCLIVSDLGQVYSPPPVEGLRTYVAMLLKCGLSAKEIRLMLHRNPAHALGLD